MNDARPALPYPVSPRNRSIDEATGDGAGFSYFDWLQSLKRQDMVRIRTHTGATLPPAMVTNDTPCYVFVGRLKFHRRNGWQTLRQSSCVYRMRLRLVRDNKEFT